MRIKIVISGVIILGVIWGTSIFLYSQKLAREQVSTDISTNYLRGNRFEAQGVNQLLAEISAFYNIPIGLEVALNDNRLDDYEVDFKGGKLTDLLTLVQSQVNQNRDLYDWEIKDEVISYFPQANYRDEVLVSILETKINKFSVKENTTCENLILRLSNTFEIKSILKDNNINYEGSHFTGFYIPRLGKNLSFTVSDMSLKNILNKTIRESTTAKMWFINRNTYRSSSFSIYLYASQEDSLEKDGK